MPALNDEPRKLRLVGHKGADLIAPGNTVESFRAAVETGVDMIATAGTLCAAAQTVIDEGAARVIACATHGVFSGPAFERIENSAIERIVVTDTLPLRPGAPDNITVLSTAGIFADSIRSIFTDGSVSEIFAGENQLF